MFSQPLQEQVQKPLEEKLKLSTFKTNLLAQQGSESSPLWYSGPGKRVVFRCARCSDNMTLNWVVFKVHEIKSSSQKEQYVIFAFCTSP